MQNLRLAVLFGGRACEHDVSIISGLQAADAAQKAGYTVERIYIDRDGYWQIGDPLKDIAFYKNYDASALQRVLPLGENGKLVLIEYPTEKKSFFGTGKHILGQFDVAFPVMHGMNGEDGTLQGMLDLLDVPYTSAGVLGCAVGMDKIAMKMLFKGCGFPVLPASWLDRNEWETSREAVLDRLEKEIEYPVFVKPANLGSSIGISRADDRKSLAESIDVAASYDRRVLVEKGVVNLREVNCSVLGFGNDIQASVLEMPRHWGELLDFDTKYLQGGKGSKNAGMANLAREIPAPISEELTKQVQELSLQVFRCLDMKGVVRIDYILDGETLYLNEVNTIPGSLAFYLWEAMGVSFEDMVHKMVLSAMNAHSERKKSVFSYDSKILQAQLGGAKGGAKGSTNKQ